MDKYNELKELELQLLEARANLVRMQSVVTNLEFEIESLRAENKIKIQDT